MDWLEIAIEIPSERIEEAYGILLGLGIEGVQIVSDDYMTLTKDEQDWDYYEEVSEGESKLIIYLPTEDENQLLIIEDKMTELLGRSVKLSKKVLNESQWTEEWKKYFKPAKITDRIVIKPTWENYEKGNDDELIIDIDPGMAFGTGTHATTSMCLKLLEKYMEPNKDVVLDLGCGSGILSIAAAKLFAKKITGIEIDPVAVEIAKENVHINHLSHRIDIAQGDITKEMDIKADIIVANLMTELIISLAKDIKEHLEGKKLLIASGILIEKQDKVIDQLKRLNFEIMEVLNEKEWAAIAARL